MTISSLYHCSCKSPDYFVIRVYRFGINTPVAAFPVSRSSHESHGAGPSGADYECIWGDVFRFFSCVLGIMLVKLVGPYFLQSSGGSGRSRFWFGTGSSEKRFSVGYYQIRLSHRLLPRNDRGLIGQKYLSQA